MISRSLFALRFKVKVKKGKKKTCASIPSLIMQGDWIYRNSCEDDVRLPVDKAKKEKRSKMETRSFLHKHTLMAREMVIVSNLINGKLLIHSLRRHF